MAVLGDDPDRVTVDLSASWDGRGGGETVRRWTRSSSTSSPGCTALHDLKRSQTEHLTRHVIELDITRAIADVKWIRATWTSVERKTTVRDKSANSSTITRHMQYMCSRSSGVGTAVEMNTRRHPRVRRATWDLLPSSRLLRILVGGLTYPLLLSVNKWTVIISVFRTVRLIGRQQRNVVTSSFDAPLAVT